MTTTLLCTCTVNLAPAGTQLEILKIEAAQCAAEAQITAFHFSLKILNQICHA